MRCMIILFMELVIYLHFTERGVSSATAMWHEMATQKTDAGLVVRVIN